jgi:hypothetical protein
MNSEHCSCDHWYCEECSRYTVEAVATSKPAALPSQATMASFQAATPPSQAAIASFQTAMKYSQAALSWSAMGYSQAARAYSQPARAYSQPATELPQPATVYSQVATALPQPATALSQLAAAATALSQPAAMADSQPATALPDWNCHRVKLMFPLLYQADLSYYSVTAILKIRMRDVSVGINAAQLVIVEDSRLNSKVLPLFDIPARPVPSTHLQIMAPQLSPKQHSHGPTANGGEN